ncbi:MAG: zinc ribbon domain-containing protein [Planctomycetales bacterium]|nr:zinc ribbon domain-containing protein [Planctomycetales bacterium]
MAEKRPPSPAVEFCPACKTVVSPRWNRCPMCETRLRGPCPRCGKSDAPPLSTKCPRCGKDFQQKEEDAEE